MGDGGKRRAAAGYASFSRGNVRFRGHASDIRIEGVVFPHPERHFHVAPMQQDGWLVGRYGMLPAPATRSQHLRAWLPRVVCPRLFGLAAARPEWQDGASVGSRSCGKRRGTSELQHLLWMPSNVGNLRHSYCETDANARCTPPGVLLPSSCRAFSGPPTYAARRRAFLRPKVPLLRNGTAKELDGKQPFTESRLIFI